MRGEEKKETPARKEGKFPKIAKKISSDLLILNPFASFSYLGDCA